ncbi:hypothetical protein CSEC_2356 [Criblamydia sequanensis CRIB-18]|uniref:Uncharacterized protein n=1 Tax=Candidatus Criblamydia sequanensis CRIB-18 TaxID=1437425 RepID=A0A090D0T6_9BACT|nr:hypothetical protein CSEC_2356 [Criblamydia sequanensis CRIB-18]
MLSPKLIEAVLNKIISNFRLFILAIGCLINGSPLKAEPFAWSPSSIIDTSTNLSLDNVTNCQDPLHNRVFAAWVDLVTDVPLYSIYSNGSWSSPAFIDPSMNSEGLRCVYLCYDSQNDRIFAAWNDINNNNYPTYSIYYNESWSAPSVISVNIPVGGGDVFLCYNPVEDQVFATWIGDTGSPIYSIHSSNSWSAPALISSTSYVSLNVYTCFRSTQNEIVATWADVTNGGIPTYSIYNGSSWSSTGTIGVAGDADNVFVSYNNLEDIVMATWVDIGDNGVPTYSIYNGTSWSSPLMIDSESIIGAFTTLFTCYDSLHNQFFAAWPGEPNCSPVYSIYNNGFWSPKAYINIEPPGVIGDVFLSYNPLKDQVFATWADCITSLPFYSIYQDTAPNLPLPPTDLVGLKKKNKFATQTEWFNELTWNPPLSGLTPVSYRIYRDSPANLIGVVPAAGPLIFIDNRINKQKSYTYYVTSVDIEGDQSEPYVVIIR